MKNINQNDYNDLMPAQKILIEQAIDKKKSKVLKPYMLLIIFLSINIYIFSLIYSTRSSVYYIFFDRPNYEDLYTVKGKAELLTTSGGKSGVTFNYLTIKGSNQRFGCSLSKDRYYNYIHTKEYVGKDIELKVDQFNVTYECKVADFIKRNNYEKESIFQPMIIIFFILEPVYNLYDKIVKNEYK